MLSLQYLLIIICLILFLSTTVFLWKFQDERNRNLYLQGKFNPYKKKKYFLTGAEVKLLSILEQSDLPNLYRIYPQLHLSTLFDVKDEAMDLRGKFEWLNNLYVDFVLFDKEKLLPQLVIELNDATHKMSFRKARDQFVRKVLEQNDVEYLPIEVSELQNSQDLLDKIRTHLFKPQNPSA